MCTLSVHLHSSFCYFYSPDGLARAKWIRALHAVEQLENTVLRPHVRLSAPKYTSKYFFFPKTALGLRNRALPFPQHNRITFLEQNVLVSGDLEEVLAGTPAFLVV